MKLSVHYQCYSFSLTDAFYAAWKLLCWKKQVAQEDAQCKTVTMLE